jgi:ubiquinone/menaquinone biosynthesis C-methylase UbiE
VGALGQTVLGLLTSAGSQNFLGARWIGFSLDLVPSRWKRPLALNYLAMSPHYFFRTSTNSGMSRSEFLESEYQRNRTSRQLIIEEFLVPYLEPNMTCMDFGCGPGFLARAAAPYVTKVIACDISRGAIACAKVINSNPAIDYRLNQPGSFLPLGDESVDLIYSFAVFQHVSDDVLKGILREFRRVIKPSRTIVCHVVIDQDGWKTESEWRSDMSIKGQLKRCCGMLQCFSRSRNDLETIIAGSGFRLLKLERIADLNTSIRDDISTQYLCVCLRED